VGRRLFLAAMLACALPAQASTGNFLPQVASLFLVIPALLLAPAVAIAFSREQAERKRRWIIASVLLALLSFGSLYWAARVYSVLAGTSWPWVYLWVLPGFVLWVAFRRVNRGPDT
jgi:hypothetical protein